MEFKKTKLDTIYNCKTSTSPQILIYSVFIHSFYDSGLKLLLCSPLLFSLAIYAASFTTYGEVKIRGFWIWSWSWSWNRFWHGLWPQYQGVPSCHRGQGLVVRTHDSRITSRGSGSGSSNRFSPIEVLLAVYFTKTCVDGCSNKVSINLSYSRRGSVGGGDIWCCVYRHWFIFRWARIAQTSLVRHPTTSQIYCLLLGKNRNLLPHRIGPINCSRSSLPPEPPTSGHEV